MTSLPAYGLTHAYWLNGQAYESMRDVVKSLAGMSIADASNALASVTFEPHNWGN